MSVKIVAECCKRVVGCFLGCAGTAGRMAADVNFTCKDGGSAYKDDGEFGWIMRCWKGGCIYFS